ncbi:hypothetical protein DO62_5901 [Burkholderia pseudomallei]|nr:hypothetical protein DO62_5901 [Burkholderia pseudomallei]
MRAKAGGPEALGERGDRRRAHGLRAVERDAPARQVEPGRLLGRDPLDAQPVSEVRPAGRHRAPLRDCPQPAQRPLQERRRRHRDAVRAAVERLQHAADQAHVVVVRHPHHGGRRVIERHRLRDHPFVGEKVPVTDDDALRPARRARRVLQERDVVRRGPRRRGAPGAVGERVVDEQRVEPRERRGARERPADRVGLRPASEYQPHARVAHDRLERRGAAPGARQLRRNRDHARRQAAPERREKIRPRRKQQHRHARRVGRAGQAPVERGRDRVRALHEARVVEQVGRRALLLRQIRVRGPIGLPVGARAHDVDHRRCRRGGGNDRRHARTGSANG